MIEKGRQRVIRHQVRRFVAALALTCVGAGAAAERAADDRSGEPRDADTVRADLAEVNRRIGELTRELNGARDAHAREQAALREIELRRAAIAARARSLADEIEAGSQRVSVLEERVIERRIAYLAQRARLGRHARAAYAAGRRTPLEMLLGEREPGALARTLALHGQVQREHAARIRELERAYRELAGLAARLEEESTALAETRDESARADAALAAEQRARALLVDGLAQSLDDAGLRLDSLRGDAARLQKLLWDLPRELEQLPLEDVSLEPFAERRGALDWPVAGAVMHRFGTRRGPDLIWQGILIQAEDGRAVRAVADGRVAYADWLRGFGLLIIIEHDGGYMSLYGRNQSLFKEVGDWVESAEVVATVGDSGGAEGTGLYFEIRHRGEPQDPLAWVGARPDG